jgi:hypothetical protein
MKNIGYNAFDENVKLDISNTRLVELENNSYAIATEITVEGQYNYDYAYEVLDLVNKERIKSGLLELKMDEDLLNSVKTEFMMHQSNLNKKNSKAKELMKIITGSKSKGKDLNLILGDEEV